MGAIIIIAIIAAIIGVIWLMRNVPSASNIILTFVGLTTFLGVLVSLDSKSSLLQSTLLGADTRIVPAPDIADLLFNVGYKTVGGEFPENQKWWTIGTSNWVLAGSVVNKSDKELTKLKFEVFIKYGANIIGDEAVITQHSWKVPPGQDRAFTTYSNTFKNLPATKSNPIWGVKLIEINDTSVKADIVWSPDNHFDNPLAASKRVKTIEIIPK
jgi:hypothetical protein